MLISYLDYLFCNKILAICEVVVYCLSKFRNCFLGLLFLWLTLYAKVKHYCLCD